MMDNRPRIPREWYEASWWRTPAFVCFALGLLFVPVWAIIQVGDSNLPLWAKGLSVLLLMVLAAHGIHMTGWVGHEGLHCNLHRNKYVSFIIGIIVGAAGTSSVVGHALNHWNHHRFVNTASDPDAQMYAQYRSFRSRLWGPRATSHSAFHRYTILCALGREMPVGFRLPFPPATARRLAWFGLCALGMSAAGWLSLLVLHPAYGILCYVAPALLIAGPMSSWRVFAEHADTDTGIWTNSRSYTHWLYTALFFGNNYHLEHHLYPGVPCYNLPKVHKLLCEARYYEHHRSFIDRDLRGPLALTRGCHIYPQATGPDLKHDPFAAELQDHPGESGRLATGDGVASTQIGSRYA
jgi:fatty acid desaturase